MKLIVLCSLLLVGGPVVASAAPSESDLYSEAESRYLGHNYTAALEAYDSFLASYPLSARTSDVQYRRVVCLYRLQRYREAVTLSDDVQKRYSSTRYIAYVPLWKGLSLYALGSYSLSVDSLDTFLSGDKDPEFTPQALVHKALALHALANDTAAIQSLQTMTTDYPSSPLFPYASVLLGSLLRAAGTGQDLLSLTQATDSSSFPSPWKDEFLLLRAEALWDAGRTADAQPLYLQLVGAPNDVALVAYGRLFSAAQARNDLPQMRDLTQAAETRFTGNTALLSQLWTRVGAESFLSGALDQADSFLRRAWNVRDKVPVNEVVPLYLSEILLGKKDPAGARQMLVDFLAAGAPGTGAAIIRLGDIALMGDDFSTAAGYYSQFRSTFPDSKRAPEAGALLAYCLFRQNKAADASRLVDDLLQQGDDPSLTRQLLKLRVVLLNGAQRTADAAAALQEYVTRFPDDLRSRLDYLKTLFLLQKYGQIITEADAVRKQFPDIDGKDPYAAIVTSYLRGLALISTKDYRRAVGDLVSIKADVAGRNGLSVIVPYARYYLGWAYLRTSDFARAAQTFDSLAVDYPKHELFPMIVYLAGWSHFSAGEYDRAAGYFATGSSRGGTDDLSQKSQYLLAKSLLNQKKSSDALPVLQKIIASSPAWAPDALFDYAGALSDLGQTQAAADAYRKLYDTYTDSPLREEALYRRAETYWTHGMAALARAGFDDYRTRYPNGKLVDAALYWGGQAATSMGEGMAAALLWEQMLTRFRTSSFRGPALQQTAEAYATAQQYAKARDYYTQYIAEFPDDARAARADIRAEQFRLLAGGAGDQEAQLSAIIAKETGDKKRQATIDLARLYIYSGDKRADTGYKLLLPLLKDPDTASAAAAQALVGEYFYRKADLAEAARQFLAVAVIPKVDPDAAAAAIYRAAEMMQLAKRPDDVSALVQRLQTGFPNSPWTVKARTLAGGAS